MIREFKALVCSTPLFLLGAFALQATPLVPGGTVSPVTITGAVPAGSPILTDALSGTQGGLNEGFSWKKFNLHPPTTLGASGNFISAVYRDPSTGTLDFYYQIQNTFTKAANGQDTLVNSFHLTNWANIVVTSVEQLTTTTAGAFFGDGHSVEFMGKTGDNVTSVSRTAGTGDDITVNLATALAPGQNTSVLLIKTTAVNFDLGAGTFSWITAPPACTVAPTATNLNPCGVADLPTFGLGALEPVVPEPGFYGVLALGMSALWMGVHRRSVKAKKLEA